MTVADQPAVAGEPSSLKDAIAERQQLINEIQAIEGQMSDPDRRDEYGARLDAISWHQWRKRARSAWQFKLARLRFLKAWIRNNQPQQVSLSERLAESVELLMAVVEDSGYPLSAGQQVVFDSLVAWRRANPL